MSGVIICITGPSCAGKSTLESLLVREIGYSKIISHTTRKQRSGEVDGKAYFFVTPSKFDDIALRADGFAEVVTFNGSRYGASAAQFFKALDKGENAVVVAEPCGRDAIEAFAHKHEVPFLPVFVDNPSDVIAARFMERCFTDFSLSISAGNLSEVVKTCSARLGVMMGEERHWESSTHHNAMLFPRFDRANEYEVVTRITQYAAALTGSLEIA